MREGVAACYEHSQPGLALSATLNGTGMCSTDLRLIENPQLGIPLHLLMLFHTLY